MSEILGKDRDVKETINLVKGILNKIGFNLEERNLLNPVKGIWSVNLQDKDSQFYTNGKGSTKDNCLASAYCEFLERFASGFFFYDYALDGQFNNADWTFAKDEKLVKNSKKYKEEILNKDLWSFYDPDSVLEFISFTDSNRCDSSSILSLPFKNSNNQLTYFPLEILKNLYASNGLSAGNSERETLIQGFSECIERGVKNYIISEGISLPTISNEYLNNLNFSSIISDIEEYGYKVIVKDASLEGRFPVICVLLINKNKGNVLSSFGSHPNVKIAIERTLTELLQGRQIDSLQDFSTLSFNNDQISDYANLESHFINSSGVLHFDLIKETKKEFTLWESVSNLDDELDYLKKILTDEGYQYFYRTIEVEGMWVSQTIIPKLSEIYPIEDLELEFKNRAGFIREFLKNDVSIKYIKDNIDWFNESYIDENSNIMEYLGISIDENDDLSSLLLFEIELLMLLKLNNKDLVSNIINYQLNFDLISESRIGLWRCLQCLINKYSKHYVDLLFSKQIVESAEALYKGIIPRNYFPLLNDNFSKIERHNKFNSVYKKYKSLFI